MYYKARSTGRDTMRTASCGKRHRAPAGSPKEARNGQGSRIWIRFGPAPMRMGERLVCGPLNAPTRRFETRVCTCNPACTSNSACSRRSDLTDRFGDASILEYFSQRALHATSAQAFEAAFGLTLDEFYDEFAAWRAEGFRRDE